MQSSRRPSVLVTGGAKRIGAEIARRFGDEGWHVVIHCNNSKTAAEELAHTLPSAEVVRCDLEDSSAAVAMVEELASRFDDWRVLVNSASIFQPDGPDCSDIGLRRRTMRINSESPICMAQAFLGHRRADGARVVVNITDQKLANPNPDFFSYTLSKHALAASIPMLAMASGPDDRIYGLAPGAILQSHDQTPEEFEQASRLNLLHRHTNAGEVADAAWFLAQGLLESGQTLFIDSGQHLMRQGRDVIYLAREGGA